MRSYIDKSCEEKEPYIFVYLHKGVVAVEQSALTQPLNAQVPANKMQCKVYYILHRCIFRSFKQETNETTGEQWKPNPVVINSLVSACQCCV